MRDMGRSRPPGAEGRLERAVGALIPPTLPRSAPPVPLPVPSLARPSPDAHAQLFLLDMARLDASGRFVCRPLLRALNWAPGQRVDLTALDDAVLFTSHPAGRTKVGQRGEIAIPSSARVTAGLDQETQVLLMAAPDQGTLIAHPPGLMVTLLIGHYRSQAAGASDE